MKYKKIIAFLLTFVCIVSLTSATAIETPETPQNDEQLNGQKQLMKIADDQWVEVNKDSSNYSMYNEELAGETVVVEAEKNYESIYSARDGQQYQRIDTSTYVPVKRIDMNLADYSTYETLEKQYNLPDEVMESVASMADLAIERECNQAGIEIFVQDVETRAGNNIMPRESTKYNGKTFYHYQIYFTNMWTQWQTLAKKADVTKTFLNTIAKLTVSTVGQFSTGAGITQYIFDGFSTIMGAWDSTHKYTPIYGHNKNAVQVNIGYNILLKYSFVYDPVSQVEWYGSTTQKVRINEIDTDIYLYDNGGGHRLKTVNTPNKLYYSANFLKPEPKIIETFRTGFGETVKIKVYGRDLILVWNDFKWPSSWPKII